VSGLASGLYAGVVTHVRFGPRRHRLRYRIFMLLIDLDEQAELTRRLKLFGPGRLFAFRERDHLEPGRGPLKAQVEAHLAAAGLAHGGPVRVLCMPRLLGRAFSPLSIYFCHDGDGRLSAVLYEVNNTFGERRAYLMAAGPERPLRQACGKDFFVSPFMDMALTYAFTLAPPGERVGVRVQASGQEPVLVAAFHASRRELSDTALLRAWLGHPTMTLGVLAAIHWEALKIWLKGEPLRPRPPLRTVFVGHDTLPTAA